MHSIAAVGFGNQADAYEKARPSYPIDAVQNLIQQLNLTDNNNNNNENNDETQKKEKFVIEIGAGTGKFTRLLKNHKNLKILAVEPVENMRIQFQNIIPDIEIIDGFANKLPIESGVADAVIAAQSFHWFATRETLLEFHRVLKPNGKLGLIWNRNDDSANWVSKFTTYLLQFETDVPQFIHYKWRNIFNECQDLFGPSNEIEFQHYEHNCSKELIWQRVLSRSYIAAMNNEQQEIIKTNIYKILNENIEEFKQNLNNDNNNNNESSDVIATPTTIFPYKTLIFWCTKI
eukprot:TRINITY_DN338_c0_g3_i1.p1 TRINITY_DN338_c0_g3~~TRINITY_DN338_c0_g3_i1.p1  ORF type:complete len:289 (+),score=139.43 TRINITY_DN338_c0_g3_i1:39-905(+)